MVQPKPRFAGLRSEHLHPHMIRASVDFRVPNQFMERSRISQAATVKDFIHKFHDCTIWTQFDLRKGYHQLELHPESRSVAAFSSPLRNFRPKRLIIGAKASQDVFDKAMCGIFGDIPQCLNQRDDILIGASNWKKHYETLKIIQSPLTSLSVNLARNKSPSMVNNLARVI